MKNKRPQNFKMTIKRLLKYMGRHIEDYDSAIDTYLKYISTNNFYEGDEYLYVYADFLYRIGIIYNGYLKDLETSRTYMECSFNTLKKSIKIGRASCRERV